MKESDPLELELQPCLTSVLGMEPGSTIQAARVRNH